MIFIRQALYVALLLSAALYSGCQLELPSESEEKVAQDADADDTSGSNKPGDGSGDDPAGSEPVGDIRIDPILFDADLVSVDYDKEKDEIVLVIRHSICSQTFKPVLVISDVCGESYPLSCSATIESEQPFAHTCENMLPTEVELRASVAELQKPANVSIRGKNKGVGSILLEQ